MGSLAGATPPQMRPSDVAEYFAERGARQYLEAVRWPGGPSCAHCGSATKCYAIAPNAAARIRPGLYFCGDCRQQFTVTVRTMFEDSKVPLRTWLAAWYALCSHERGRTAAELQSDLDIADYRTAWKLLNRIRFALWDPVFEEPMREHRSRRTFPAFVARRIDLELAFRTRRIARRLKLGQTEAEAIAEVRADIERRFPPPPSRRTTRTAVPLDFDRAIGLALQVPPRPETRPGAHREQQDFSYTKPGRWLEPRPRAVR